MTPPPIGMAEKKSSFQKWQVNLQLNLGVKLGNEKW